MTPRASVGLERVGRRLVEEQQLALLLLGRVELLIVPRQRLLRRGVSSLELALDDLVRALAALASAGCRA